MDDRKHGLVSDIKRVVDELGKIPTQQEFLNAVGYSRTHIEKTFVTWSAALAACGLEKPKPGKMSLPEIRTEEGISDAIESNRDRRIIHLNEYKKIMCVGDVHFPFHHDKAIEKTILIINREKPDIIVQMGDLFDQYAASKFPRSLNTYTPKAEFDLAKQLGEKFWKDIKEASPKSERFQLIGNHDVRAMKRIMEAWPAGEHFIEPVMRQLYTFDGVKTIYDPSEELKIKDILFIHGYLGQLGAHRDYNQSNIVCGHTHRGSVSYRAIAEKTLWELNCGFLGDPYSKALSYRPQKIHNWTLGLGLIDPYGPRFINF